MPRCVTKPRNVAPASRIRRHKAWYITWIKPVLELYEKDWFVGVWSSPTMLSDPGDRSPAVTSRSIPPRLEQPRPSPAVSSRLQPSPAVSSRLKRPISQMTLFWAEISHAHGKKCPPERDCCSRWLPIPWGSSLDDVCDAPASQIPAGSAYPTSVHDRYEVTIDRYMVVT